MTPTQLTRMFRACLVAQANELNVQCTTPHDRVQPDTIHAMTKKKHEFDAIQLILLSHWP